MDDDETLRPFRRERIISNRNFRRRSSDKKIDSPNKIDDNEDTTNKTLNVHLKNTIKQKGLSDQDKQLQAKHDNFADGSISPDPAFLAFQQKLQHFETLIDDEPIINKTGSYKSKDNVSTINVSSQSVTLSFHATSTTPTSSTSLAKSYPPLISATIQSSSLVNHIDSESDFTPCNEYHLSTKADRDIGYFAEDSVPDISREMFKLTIDAFSEEPKTSDSCAMGNIETSNLELSVNLPSTKNDKDFPRNYRSTPRPKTEITATTNMHLITKYNSFRDLKNEEETEDENEVELRDRLYKNIKPILDELINSEISYVGSLYNGIKNYSNIFERQDLPVGLRGKKYVLLGNIEKIAEFHRDEFLPMLERNRRNLKSLFDEFQQLIEQNCFYGYVIFTMNKQKSLKLCDEYKNYFKMLQTELNDKLGINSFLVQPIQRIAKYPLMLKEFISALFENRATIMKALIESCCRLDKKIRTLLTTTNESEVVNDVVECHEFNVFYQGKFRKVSEFNVLDHTLKRSYRSKVFIFDKCIIYTEIKGKNLVFHGRYPCEHIGIVAKTKSFTLFYQKRKQQECDFNGEVPLIEMWMELIREMVSAFASEERRKLQELYSRESDHMHRMPPNLSLFRDSNRFSSDSGIGNIWVMPKPELAEDSLSNRSTWYAET